MQIRAARTLLFSRREGAVEAFNFLSRSAFQCSPDLLLLLNVVDDWTSLSELERRMPQLAATELRETVDQLIEVGALVTAGSGKAAAEEYFEARWKWGLPAAAFHFSLRDRPCMPIEEAEALQVEKAAASDQPPLYLGQASALSVVTLPSPFEGNELLQLMARRRTVREAALKPVTIQQLSDCLFAGMGITGKTRNCVGELPLGMTPSGGARNPFEAYVYARAVEGLQPGFYHYAAAEHTLGRLAGDELPLPSELLGSQDWADDMPAVILLCAHFERTMWKYDDAGAYRVVLIEAGHIGQNVMLAATRYGLSACPTAALHHAAIERCLNLGDTILSTPIYALTLGFPPSEDDGRPVVSRTEH